MCSLAVRGVLRRWGCGCWSVAVIVEDKLARQSRMRRRSNVLIQHMRQSKGRKGQASVHRSGYARKRLELDREAPEGRHVGGWWKGEERRRRGRRREGESGGGGDTLTVTCSRVVRQESKRGRSCYSVTAREGEEEGDNSHGGGGWIGGTDGGKGRREGRRLVEPTWHDAVCVRGLGASQSGVLGLGLAASRHEHLDVWASSRMSFPILVRDTDPVLIR